MGASAAFYAFYSEEEEELVLGGDDIISLPPNIPVEGLSEEEQLAIALKTSINTALEERATGKASLIYIELQVTYPFIILLLFSFSLLGTWLS